jgi:NAD(P)-dependent dehydrogenase (short-subunit alcohol dehydrogenase family)
LFPAVADLHKSKADTTPATMIACGGSPAQLEARMSGQKTILITGASQGIGAGLVKAFLDKSWNVVGTFRRISNNPSFDQTARLELVDGDVGDPATAERVAHRAVDRFGSIGALVNNAGIFFRKPFLQFTIEHFRQLSATNIEGFIHFTKRAIRQMLLQNSGGSVVTIRSSLTDHPIAGVAASLPMITKGGLHAITKSLALELARENIRVDTLSPGVVDTPLHAESPKNHLNALSPIGTITAVQEIVNGVVDLTESANITGEVLHVDHGAHSSGSADRYLGTMY